jgi:hypothetical protein
VSQIDVGELIELLKLLTLPSFCSSVALLPSFALALLHWLNRPSTVAQTSADTAEAAGRHSSRPSRNSRDKKADTAMSCSISAQWVVLCICMGSLFSVCTSFQPTTLYDMQYMTSPEVREYTQLSSRLRGVGPIIIPIGATEQHGPTGLIGTDILTASAVASEVASLEGCLLGPPISIGMSLHHCGFPGSVSLRPSTLASVICDVVWSLQQSSNITHFFFVNGHGGNMKALEYARYMLERESVSLVGDADGT